VLGHGPLAYAREYSVQVAMKRIRTIIGVKRARRSSRGSKKNRT
jgi:hypothetical protein